MQDPTVGFFPGQRPGQRSALARFHADNALPDLVTRMNTADHMQTGMARSVDMHARATHANRHDTRRREACTRRNHQVRTQIHTLVLQLARSPCGMEALERPSL